jgi:5-methylcytosine-specific restriction endonuclease McrA
LKTRFCSDRCGKNASRARTGRFTIPPQVRSAIYERDAWTCQLCRSPVDPDLPPSDVWAATLDHIECQSWALVPDHSPENLRLAHRWCNSVRGDESHYTAAVLSS